MALPLSQSNYKLWEYLWLITLPHPYIQSLLRPVLPCVPLSPHSHRYYLRQLFCQLTPGLLQSLSSSISVCSPSCQPVTALTDHDLPLPTPSHNTHTHTCNAPCQLPNSKNHQKKTSSIPLRKSPFLVNLLLSWSCFVFSWPDVHCSSYQKHPPLITLVKSSFHSSHPNPNEPADHTLRWCLPPLASCLYHPCGSNHLSP